MKIIYFSLSLLLVLFLSTSSNAFEIGAGVTTGAFVPLKSYSGNVPFRNGGTRAALGLNAEFIPFSSLGVRATYLQSFQKNKTKVLLAGLIYRLNFLFLHPFVWAGAGESFFDEQSTSAKKAFYNIGFGFDYSLLAGIRLGGEYLFVSNKYYVFGGDKGANTFLGRISYVF